jgi:adenine-specific DNA-methyltransferase
MRDCFLQTIFLIINKQLEAQAYNPSILAKLKEINLAENNKFFHWHTWFSDVFSRDDKEGFDIVIGNPPYIGEKGHKEIFQPVKADIHLGQYYLGKMDYFYFFFHLAFNMLSPNGVTTFITTNYYPTALGARRLRADIKDRKFN